MEILFTVTVSAGLFLAADAFWRRFADKVAADGPGDADETTVEWALFSLPFIRRRLAALAEELDRLDHDPDVFAKAFHTKVARSAYEELLAEASRLATQPPRHAGQTLDVEIAGTSTRTREVLEL